LILISLDPFTQRLSDERLTADCGPPLDVPGPVVLVRQERRGVILLSSTVLVKRPYSLV
jgi:hypothetical protein